MEIIDLLAYTKKNNASDLHLSPDCPPCVRLNGEMQSFTDEILTAEQIKSMVYSIMTDAQRSYFEREYEIDFAIQFGHEMRFRINAYTTINGTAVAFRVIPTEISSIDALNLPQIFKKISNLTKGLVLVTGPTGSGKSTTLAAILNEINRNQSKHIITIEDPVEFIHKSNRSIINQRQVHSSTKSFGAALRSALREDPDVILVGEMRDLETISLALTAAETGHLVLATLHTSSAPKTIDRIIDVFPATDKEVVRSMLSSSLEAIISQTLIKTIDGESRVAAFEVMLGTSAVRNLIRENKIPQVSSLIQIGSKQGMISMTDSIELLLSKKVISEQDAARAKNILSGDANITFGDSSGPTNYSKIKGGKGSSEF
jgi:twitching motility protein PilT